MNNPNTTMDICVMFTYHSLTANNEKCLQVINLLKKGNRRSVYVPQLFEIRMANDLSDIELANLAHERHQEYVKAIGSKAFEGVFVFFDEKEYAAFTPEMWVFEKDILSHNGTFHAYWYDAKSNSDDLVLIEPRTPHAYMPTYGNNFPVSIEGIKDKRELEQIVANAVENVIQKYLSDISQLSHNGVPDKEVDALSASSLSMTEGSKQAALVNWEQEEQNPEVPSENDVYVTAHFLAAMYNCTIQAIYERAKLKNLPHRKYGNKKTLYEFNLKKAQRHFKKFPLQRHETYRP